MKKIILSWLLLWGCVAGVLADGLSFGIFTSSSDRVKEFKQFFRVGDRVSGALDINGKKYHLPDGDWRVAAVVASVGNIRNVSTGNEDSSNPHGQLFLFSSEKSGVDKFLAITLPLGPLRNRSWVSNVPGLCQADWSQKSKLWHDAVSLDHAALDCSAVYVGKIFSWNDGLTNAAKFGLKDLGVTYARAANYLASGTYVSRGAGTYFLTYGEYVDGERYEDIAPFKEKNEKVIEMFNYKSDKLRRSFHQDIGG